MRYHNAYQERVGNRVTVKIFEIFEDDNGTPIGKLFAECKNWKEARKIIRENFPPNSHWPEFYSGLLPREMWH